jgi:hypothetical protein
MNNQFIGKYSNMSDNGQHKVHLIRYQFDTKDEDYQNYLHVMKYVEMMVTNIWRKEKNNHLIPIISVQGRDIFEVSNPKMYDMI